MGFYVQNYSKNMDKVCPMKEFKVAEFKEVWMTNEAVEAIKDKERALNKTKRTTKRGGLETG